MRQLFAIADFRRLWLAGAIGSAVRWLDTLAFSVVAYQQSGSAFVVAMLSMLRLLPMGLLGALIGAYAERVQRRGILLAMLLAMLATTMALAGLALGGRLAVWHLAVASFLNGISWACDSTVRRLLLSEVVGGGLVGAAVAFDSASGNASRMLGPTLGGVLLTTIGVEGAFGLDIALYLVALWATWGIAFRNPVLPRGGGGMLARMLAGFALVRRERVLSAILCVTMVFNLWGWPSTSMVPVLAQGRLGLGSEATGLLASMDGLGALLASLVIGALVRPGWHGRLHVGGTLLYFVMQIGLAAAGEAVLAGGAVLMTGVAAAAFGITQTTLIYQATPPDMRSRMFGVLSACIGLGPLGFVHLGLLADWIGAPWATAVVGVEGLVAMGVTWRVWRVLLL